MNTSMLEYRSNDVKDGGGGGGGSQQSLKMHQTTMMPDPDCGMSSMYWLVGSNYHRKHMGHGLCELSPAIDVGWTQ